MVDNEKLRLEFAARLNEVLDNEGIRVRGRAVDVAREMTIRVAKISPMAAGLWLKGETMPKALYIKGLCAWLNLRQEWLQYGVLPQRGAAKIDIKIGVASPKVLKLAARIADLEQRGRLTNELLKALNAVLDTA